MAMIIFLVLTFFLQGALGEIICEQLPVQMCTFSVASTGNRCVLESYGSNAGSTEFQCKTSDVFAENVAQWIEDDHCVEACGVDRKTVGISSDSLAEPQIIASVCSTACYDNCPNIVDLYYNLALAEGTYLPNLCKAQNAMSRREMSQVLAWAPVSGNAESFEFPAWTPAPAPTPINAESYESPAWTPVPAPTPVLAESYEFPAWTPTPALAPTPINAESYEFPAWTPTPAPAPAPINAESYEFPAWTPTPAPAPTNAESYESVAWAPVPASVEPFIPITLAPTPFSVIPFIPISWPPAPAPASDN